jgi:transposase
MTRKVLQALTESKELEAELRMAFGALLAVYEALQIEIQRIEKMLKQQSKTDPRIAVYHSIPGFGHCNTHVLATELGDMSQFQNERTLFSFLGLTPSESSSGEGKDRRGHITRQGNPQLRAILIQAAWTAVRTDAYWRHVYTSMTPRTGGKKAIVGIARRLTGVARSLFRKKELYQQQPIPGQAIAAAA